MRRAGDGPPAWLQALPFAAVFVFFFIAPLLLVGAVSLWPTSDYELKPGFTFANYQTIFDGCTGARILTTLIHALKKRGQRRGIACRLCSPHHAP